MKWQDAIQLDAATIEIPLDLVWKTMEIRLLNGRPLSKSQSHQYQLSTNFNIIHNYIYMRSQHSRSRHFNYGVDSSLASSVQYGPLQSSSIGSDFYFNTAIEWYIWWYIKKTLKHKDFFTAAKEIFFDKRISLKSDIWLYSPRTLFRWYSIRD